MDVPLQVLTQIPTYFLTAEYREISRRKTVAHFNNKYLYFQGGNPVFPVMPEKAIDSTEIIPFDPKNAPDHWHDGPALPEPLYGGCLGKATKKK